MQENTVDRYLNVMTEVDLPQFGWKCLETKFVSDKRNIRVSLTGGFAKVAFGVWHEDVEFTMLVSDEVRDVITQQTENAFVERANYHRARNEVKQKPAPVVVSEAFAAEAKALSPENKTFINKFLADEQFSEQKKMAKEKFDKNRWESLGFNEAFEGDFAGCTFYVGPSRHEGQFFFKINGVGCSPRENRHSIEAAKEAAFEQWWQIVLAKERAKNKEV